MQRRPLHQVLVRHRGRDPLHAHSIDLLHGTKPRLTVTSHPAGDGFQVWYLGGALAENGVSRSEGEQIDQAQREIAATLPWVELTDAEWRTLRIDRAEPAQVEGARPDTQFVKAVRNLIVVWPVKLTLAPALGEEVEACLADQQVTPTPGEEIDVALRRSMPRAQPAPPFWQRAFQW